MEKEKDQSNKLTVRAATLAVYPNKQQINDLLEFAELIANSGFSPLRKKEDVAVAILMGKALGIDDMTAINNIHSINGRAGIGVHLITAQLLKAGVTWKVLNDFAPLYKYRDNAAVVYEFGDAWINWNNVVLVSLETKVEKIKELKEQNKTLLIRFEVDRVTEIEFRRKTKEGNELVHTEKFTLNDAKVADLYDNPKKENWTKYPKKMMYNRCFAFGARAIAADAILGMYEVSELADTTKDIEYEISDDNTITIKEKEVNKTKEEKQPIKEVVIETTERETINEPN